MQHTTRPLQQSTQAGEALAGPRLRAIVVGLVFIALMGYLVPYISFLVKTGVVSMSGSFGWAQIPTGPFMVLVLLARIVAPAVNRLLRRSVVSPGDALLAYALVLSTLAIASIGMGYYVAPLITYPFYGDGGHASWAKQVLDHVPSWLMVGGDSEQNRLVRYLYEGNPDGTPAVPWRIWVRPMTAWLGMLLALYFTATCLTGMFRRRWFRQEHITFPFAEFALAVGGAPSTWDTERGIFRERLMWVGFAIPFVHSSLMAMHFLIPGFPDLSFKDTPLDAPFRAAPWTVLQGLVFRFQWMVLGIAYLIPAQISIGTVAFYALSLMQMVVMASLGATGGEWYPHGIVQSQSTGAVLVFAVFLFYAARHDIRRMWLDLWAELAGRRVDAPHPDRWLLLGAAVGAIALIAWSHSAGLALWVAVSFIILVLTFQLVVARLVAVLGMQHATMWISPTNPIYSAVGARVVGAANIPSLKMQELVIWYAEQSSFFPMVLQAHKLGDVMRWKSGRYIGAMLVGAALALAIYTVFYLRAGYQYGGVVLSPTWYYSACIRGWYIGIASQVNNLGDPSWVPRAALLSGVGIMWALMACHRAFPWWPFHPLGYPLASGYTPRVTWPGLLMGWAIKTAVSKYGGERIYFGLRPLFLGLLLGDLSGQAFWAAVCAVAVATGLVSGV